jgi:hypothetical protein
MKVRRKSEQRFLDQKREHHEEALKAHEESVSQTEASNELAREQHANVVAEIEAAREANQRAYEQAMESYEDWKAAHETALKAAKEWEERGLAKRALDSLAKAPPPMPVPPEPVPPADPPELAVAELVLLEPPEPPELAAEEPDTFTVEQVPWPPEAKKSEKQAKDYEAFREVETAYGTTIAKAGDYILTNDNTGVVLILAPADFALKFQEVE